MRRPALCRGQDARRHADARGQPALRRDDRSRCPGDKEGRRGKLLMPGRAYVGVGGWTYEPWRDNFYPKGLPQARELNYAGEHLTAIEINGTYYGTQKRESWIKWAESVPDGFVFAVKASRFCTNRKVLA